MSQRAFDVIVVGGGIIGCAVAEGLTRRGIDTVVLEMGQVGGQASGAAAGMLAPFSEMAEPQPFLELAADSLQRYPEWVAHLEATTGADCGLTTAGSLRVAFDEEEAADLRRTLDSQGGLLQPEHRDPSSVAADAGPLHGSEATGAPRWLTAAEAREMAPLLRPDIAGAAWHPAEAHVDSPRLVQALADTVVMQGGTILEGRQVDEIIVQDGRAQGVVVGQETLGADRVVVAAGAWTERLLSRVGLSVPVRPVRGQILALEVRGAAGMPVLFSAEGYLVAKGGGRMFVGATEDDAGFDSRVSSGGLRDILDVVPALAPDLADVPFDHAWAGLRPHTPDGLPVLGPVPTVDALWVASGHFRNGILLAPVTGERLAAALAGEAAAPFDRRFAPLRFQDADDAPASD